MKFKQTRVFFLNYFLIEISRLEFIEKFSLRCYFLSSGRSRALPGLLTGSKHSTETNSEKFYQSFSPLDRGELAQADWSKKSIQIALEGLKFNLEYHAAILG